MKKTLLPVIIIFIIASVSAVVATTPKLSPFTKKFLNEMKKSGIENGMLRSYVIKSDGSKNYLSALILTNQQFDENSLSALGIKKGTRTGNVICVQIPVESMEQITQLQGVDYIQIDEPAFPTLDYARSDTRVDSVHSGIGLSMPYTGEGVVVGVVDADPHGAHARVAEAPPVSRRKLVGVDLPGSVFLEAGVGDGVGAGGRQRRGLIHHGRQVGVVGRWFRKAVRCQENLRHRDDVLQIAEISHVAH